MRVVNGSSDLRVNQLDRLITRPLEDRFEISSAETPTQCSQRLIDRLIDACCHLLTSDGALRSSFVDAVDRFAQLRLLALQRFYFFWRQRRPLSVENNCLDLVL